MQAISNFILDSSILNSTDFEQKWSSIADANKKIISFNGCRYIEDETTANSLQLSEKGFRCFCYKLRTITRKDRAKGLKYKHPVRGEGIKMLKHKVNTPICTQVVLVCRVLDKEKLDTSPTGIIIVQDLRSVRAGLEAKAASKPIASVA